MKKIIKVILGVVAVILIIIVVFWVSIMYVSDYKITTVDTSVSPDETYELVLQAVGEADFPFGSASGRLILYEGKSKISKADFELFDDGGCIRSSIWEVRWHEDCVKVILSGDEQIDEQIILYFDGRKEVKQLTDWDTGAGPQGMIPRPVVRIYLAGENEFYIAEDMEADVTQHILEKDMTIDNICNFLQCGEN